MLLKNRKDPTAFLSDARGGSKEALGSLLELYRNYLHLLARTQIDLHLKKQVHPSDLVQDTFLEAYRDFGQFRGKTPAEFRAWLRRILVHNIARLVEKHVKAQKRDLRREASLQSRIESLERSSASFEAALLSPWNSPAVKEEKQELATILADHLAQLPENYREVIVLRNFEGLPFKEVAERMELTSGAVRILWLRALDRLKQALEREDLI